jgi:hypothetical protein
MKEQLYGTLRTNARQDMRAIMTPCFAIFLLAPSLLAQSLPSGVKPPTEQDVHELNQAVGSVTRYCAAIEHFSDSHRSRFFAAAGSGTGGAWGWIEFSSKAEWERAGKPQAVAVAWYRNGNAVRAMVSFKNNGNGSYSHADYCYRADGMLAKVHSAPEVQSDCDDAYFRCELSLGWDWIYPPKGKVIHILHTDQRFLKSEQTSYSLQTTPPQYLTVWDLPFNGSTYIRTR